MIKIDTEALQTALGKVNKNIINTKNSGGGANKTKAKHDVKSFHSFDSSFSSFIKVLDNYGTSSSNDLETLEKKVNVIKETDDQLAILFRKEVLKK